jgi:tetratricopeptide (TPR) repeat protein
LSGLHRLGCLGAAALLLAGCTTASMQGQASLRAGRPAEAHRHFQDALARRPDDLDALAGLAVAEYKLGAFAKAIPLFERIVTRRPGSAQARLYLGLAHLGAADIERAVARLTEARGLGLPARTVAEIDRALPLLTPGIPDALRAFVGASLEGDLEWAAELHDARTARRAWLEPHWVIYSDSHAVYPHVHGMP